MSVTRPKRLLRWIEPTLNEVEQVVAPPDIPRSLSGNTMEMAEPVAWTMMRRGWRVVGRSGEELGRVVR